MEKIETKSKTALSQKIKEPPLYKVIYLNDEVTTMEFVIESLTTVFNYSEVTAAELTMEIHEKGSAVAGIFPYEIAEQKGIEVTKMARNNGFPLTIKIEPEV